MGIDLDESIIAKVDAKLVNKNTTQEDSFVSINNNKDVTMGELLRDSIVANIWMD